MSASATMENRQSALERSAYLDGVHTEADAILFRIGPTNSNISYETIRVSLDRRTRHEPSAMNQAP